MPPTLDKRGGNVDWIDVIGKDWYDEFTVEELDADGNVVGPLDLTGCTIVAKVGELEFTVDVIDAAGGEFSLHVDRTITVDTDPAKYPWGVKVLDADGIEVRWMYGTFTAVVDEAAL